MESLEEGNFYVVQTDGSLRNEIGPMSGTELIGHVRTRFGQDFATGQAVLAELERDGKAIGRFANSLGAETVIEIRLLPKTTIYGRGTNVPCRECGRLIFPNGPVALQVQRNEIWAELECLSPSCKSYKQPTWYPEVALEIHSASLVK